MADTRKRDVHGEPACYNAGCTCPPCLRAGTARMKRWRLDKSRGIDKVVTTDRVREHIAELRAAGMTTRAIAEAGGFYSLHKLHDIIRSERVLRRTEARILAINYSDAKRPSDLVDVTGTQRRLRALATQGWSPTDLGRRAGLNPKVLRAVRAAATPRILAGTRDAVVTLYDELWDQRGPSTRTSAYAARAGWPPPLAWDDDTIDDPDATPVGTASPHTTRSRSRAEVIEDFVDTWDHHQGDVQVAALRLGVTPMSLERTLQLARRDGSDIRFHGSAVSRAS